MNVSEVFNTLSGLWKSADAPVFAVVMLLIAAVNYNKLIPALGNQKWFLAGWTLVSSLLVGIGVILAVGFLNLNLTPVIWAVAIGALIIYRGISGTVKIAKYAGNDPVILLALFPMIVGCATLGGLTTEHYNEIEDEQREIEREQRYAEQAAERAEENAAREALRTAQAELIASLEGATQEGEIFSQIFLATSVRDDNMNRSYITAKGKDVSRVSFFVDQTNLELMRKLKALYQRLANDSPLEQHLFRVSWKEYRSTITEGDSATALEIELIEN